MGMRKLTSVSAVAMLLAVVAVAWYFLPERETPAHLIQLDSQSLLMLKAKFNQAGNGARLIVLLSPT
jgi:hypothetical protein